MFHPNKRSNMNVTAIRSPNVENQRDKDKSIMFKWVQKLYNGEIK